MGLYEEYLKKKDEEEKKSLYETYQETKKPSQVAAEKVTPPKKTLVEKAKQVVTGVGKAIFGEKEVKKSEAGRPLSVQLPDEQYTPMVGQVQQYREEAVQQLVEAEKARKDYYAGGVKQADPYLDKRVDALKWAIEDYDEFLGNEPANRGFLKSIVKSVKKNGLVPSWYEDVIATKQGDAYNKYIKGEKLTSEEQGYLNSFRASMYNTLVAQGLGDAVGEVAAGIPKYALLIFATTQGVKPSVGSFQNATMSKVPAGILQKIVPKIISNSVSLAAASNLNIPGISAQTANYMLPTVDVEKEIGKDILDQLKPGDAPMEAQKKAYLTNLVEFISEGAGAYLDDALPFVKKLIVGKWLKNNKVSLTNPNLVKKTLGSAQFNSLVGEVFEEEIAEPLRAKIEGREYADPLFTPQGRERLLVEVLGIGAFSGMAKVSDTVINRFLARRNANNDIIDIPVEVSEAKPVEEPKMPPVIEEELEKALARPSEVVEKAEEPKVAPVAIEEEKEPEKLTEEETKNKKIVSEMPAKQMVTNLQEQGGHPPEGRTTYIEEIQSRGVDKVFTELGYSTDPKTLWRNRYTGDEESLEDLLTPDENAVKFRGEKYGDELPFVLENWIPAEGKNTIKEEYEAGKAKQEAEAEAEKKAEKKAKQEAKESKGVKTEFKVGDVLDTQGNTNMVGEVTIKEITGNTLKFVDSEGTEFAGMQRSDARRAIEGGSWKKVDQPTQPPTGGVSKIGKWIDSADKGGLPNEAPEMVFKGKDNKTIAGLFQNGEGGWIIQRKDGTYLYNPNSKNAIFDTDTEAMSEFIGKEISQKSDLAKLPPISQPQGVGEEGVKKFVKRSVLQGQYRKAPSGRAELGGFSDVKSAKKMVRGIKSVEFPELVRIAKELSGDFPRLKNFQKALGRTYETGKIALSYDIFKDYVLAGKVLAHEIGHLADLLPDYESARGNLVGRIATLKKQLKWKYGELDNKVLREELLALSQKWKPFNISENEGYTKYRQSASELYADAISVLFNDPALLKADAPNFWKGFFDYIDKKPEVKDNFFKIWEMLNQEGDEVLRVRQDEIRKSFKKGEDQFAVLRAERNQRKKDYVFKAKYLLVEKGQKIYDYVKEAKKKGIAINDDEDPRYWYEEQKYVGGEVKGWVEEKIQPIYKAVTEKASWEDFAELLFHERVINERGELANPMGFGPETSKTQEEYLKKQLGLEAWQVLQDNLPKFRDAIKEIYDKGIKAGLFTDELVAVMKANPSYATFQVLDYLDTYIPASIKHQKGTLKEIANTADSTIMKATSVIFTAERNMAKKAALVVAGRLGKVEEAKTIWTGRYHEPIESRDPDKALVTVMVRGEVKGYYVDPYIAKSFDYMDTGTMKAVSEILGQRFFNSNFFRPLFITFNLGFQTFNLVRDFNRAVKAYPNRSLFNSIFHVLRGYKRALSPSFRRGWGITDKDIVEMEKSKMLSVTYNDVILGRSEYDKQIEYIFDKAGMGMFGKKKQKKLLVPFKAILQQIENLGNAIESLPKVAGYKELNGKMPTKEMASYIRRYLGSPDFLAGGAAKPLFNEVFLFSNAITQGMRSDIEIMTGPKTRAGYWWKTAWINFLPKVIMYAGLMGLFGELIRKMLEDSSEYDKTNYLVIPLSRENNQTTYLRIPSDETGRLIGGIFWKALRLLDKQKPAVSDIADLLSFTGGQAPQLSPAISAIMSTTQFLSGRNPYDSFRGRLVIPDQEFKAGGWYAWKPFLTWQINQLGGGVFWKGYASMQASDTKTWVQKVVEAPVMSNILGRWIRVSNYGQKEINNEIIKGTMQEESRTRLKERQILNDAVSEYNSGERSMVRRLKIEEKLIKDIVGEPPYKTADKTKRTNTIKKFHVALIKGESDQNINSIISATTNEQKFELLKEMKTQLSNTEFDELTGTLLEEKIISKDLMKRVRKELQSMAPSEKLLAYAGNPADFATGKAIAFSGNEYQNTAYNKLQDWTRGEASYYNPTNPAETRENTTGVGAYGRRVEPGSVAFGNRVFHDLLKDGQIIYIQVKGMEDVKTPYGKGVFRIDDTMNERYSQKGQFNIDFNASDLDKARKSKGRFPIQFRIVEPGQPKKKDLRIFGKWYA